jgi:signal transduction histidine kinase
VLGLLVSAGLSGPLRSLAGKAEAVDLDRLDVAFETGGEDEVGALSSVLDEMTRRLRASTVRVREMERQAATADLARQVNHDVKNGLIPIRNVVTHLAELARDHPDRLPSVFLERQRTLESGVAYLQSLAANYARLSPDQERRLCDVNVLVREVVRDAAIVEEREGRASVTVDAVLAARLPPVLADPVALRRILDNLVVNALESFDSRPGRVRLTTRATTIGLAPGVRIEVTDNGRGMRPEQRGRVFEGFYTTKAAGTGLGLSIVRRLVTDLGGRVDFENAPGGGTSFTVELPTAEERA